MDNIFKANSGVSRSWDVLTLILPWFALSPMILHQLAALWSREHMRFFPLVVALLAVLLLYQIPTSVNSRDRSRCWLSISIFWLGILIYFYGVWILSPWMAHAASILIFTAWALGRFGDKHWARIGAWSFLLATTLPLPWGWDIGFADWLQVLSVSATCRALDGIGIACLQHASLIETRNLLLSADEVCGGFSSVYAYIAFASALLILRHMSLAVGLTTLSLVPIWSFLGDYVRLFVIFTSQELWSRDLSSGWDYRALEVLTSLLVLLLIWVTMRFFARIFEPIPVVDAEFGPVFSAMNKLFCWPQVDPFEELEPEDEYEKQRFQRLKAEREAMAHVVPDFFWTQSPAAKWAVRAGTIVLLLSALIPLSGFASQGGLSSLNFGRPRLALAQIEALANEESLPDSLEGGWQRTSFILRQRSPRSRLGEFNLTWQYQNGPRQLQAALDLPFLGWNDPTAELIRQGWKAEPTEIRWQAGWPWGETKMENELGGTAYMFSTLLTPEGVPYTKAPTVLLGDQESAAKTSSAVSESQSTTAVTYQFQLFSESGSELSRQGQDELRKRFLELRNAAIELTR